MKINNVLSLPAELHEQARDVGYRLARLRAAHQMRQADAAARAGLSRSTASRIESGDPGVALGQLLRYAQAIAPGVTLGKLLSQELPPLLALQERERTKRVRPSDRSDEFNF
jgi:transcriptional regulator with XRE-family HTH domain